ncbi:MAG TPA: hypothetical protein VGF52_01775, partial [Tepidisphaeraceae bacterium]
MLLLGGIGCIALTARTFSHTLIYSGATLLLLAAISAIFALTIVSRSLRQLQQLIIDRTTNRKLERLDSSESQLSGVVGAVNDLFDYAEGSVNDAAMKFKELEIQLKVVTAQRQHAEAILYSISDAVLVTDPFDELVLANESAAKAFGFDLSRSPRSPVEQILRDSRMITLIREMRQSHSRAGRRIVEHVVESQGVSRTFKVT